MKFKIDENLLFLLKRLIEREGNHQVDSVYHEGLQGIANKNLMEYCLREKRILITLDTDFVNTNQPNYGIIILRSMRQGKNSIRNLFKDFLSNFNLENSIDKIVIVESTQIRVRDN